MQNFCGDGLYTYHIQKVQQLVPVDHANCLHFCRWLEGQPQEDKCKYSTLEYLHILAQHLNLILDFFMGLYEV
jgi:hypothetical protein